MPGIKAHWNCDHTYVVWRYEDAIQECRGFALERRDENGKVTVAKTWVGFADEVAGSGSTRPSTEWPIQRYMWADLEVRPGQTVSYRAVPMVGDAADLKRAEDEATGWSDPITVSASDKHGMSAFFNRGIVATQWLARRLDDDPTKTPTKALAEIIRTPGDETRNFLGGQLRDAMLKLLADIDQEGKTLYACLFELNDPELIAGLTKLGGRARVILANGTHKDGGDENEDARKALRDKGVEVHDRMIKTGLSHNKFVVVCDADGKNPERVWTGSTNWAMTGLCTQANNGILIESPEVAKVFRDQWDLIERSGNTYTDELRDENMKPKDATADGVDVTTWFVPVHAGVGADGHKAFVDLDGARKFVDDAKDGILFLMFYPGKNDTLLNYVANRGTEGEPGYDPNLYIHGVINQDTGTVKLVRRGETEPANADILTPAGIDERFGFWQKELSPGGVNVHSKVIVIDPFGANPVVMTGSHNLGHAASEHNDDNLVIIRGSAALAAAYAVNIIGIYTQYRWRYLRAHSAEQAADSTRRFARAATSGEKPWSGLRDDDLWQTGHFDGARLRELQFWLGEPVTAPAPSAQEAG